MRRDIKNKAKAFALLLPAVFLTACMNHMENGEYISTGQIMAGAFSNLVIGMGTVFAVLIFLTWVISLFKHVSRLEQAINKKNRKNQIPENTGRARKKRNKADAALKTAELQQKDGAVTEERTAVISSIEPEPSGEELQAVIAAAIAAYEADRDPVKEPEQAKPVKLLQNGIRLRSYRRA